MCRRIVRYFLNHYHVLAGPEESRCISENVTWGQHKRFADRKVTHSFQADVMECFMTGLLTIDASLPVRCSDRLWLNPIYRVTVYEDGRLVFRFRFAAWPECLTHPQFAEERLISRLFRAK